MIAWRTFETEQPESNVNIFIVDTHGGISITKTGLRGQIQYRTYRMKSKGHEYYMPRKSIKYWAPFDAVETPQKPS